MHRIPMGIPTKFHGLYHMYLLSCHIVHSEGMPSVPWNYTYMNTHMHNAIHIHHSLHTMARPHIVYDSKLPSRLPTRNRHAYGYSQQHLHGVPCHGSGYHIPPHCITLHATVVHTTPLTTICWHRNKDTTMLHHGCFTWMWYRIRTWHIHVNEHTMESSWKLNGKLHVMFIGGYGTPIEFTTRFHGMSYGSILNFHWDSTVQNKSV